MANYTHIGYYNGIDAVNKMNCTPDEIVKDMLGGEGAFQTTGEAYTEDEDYFFENFNGQVTKDEEYMLVYDIASHWANNTQEELEELLNSDEDEFCDEFIDIYKKVS